MYVNSIFVVVFVYQIQEQEQGFSVSGSNNVSGCRLCGVRSETAECPVVSLMMQSPPGTTLVRTYISILTNYYYIYISREPRVGPRTTVLRTWTKFTNNSPGLALYNGLGCLIYRTS